jgi:arsenate reductase-like glutaredoxin family protein
MNEKDIRLERAPEEARQEWLGMLESLAEQIHKQQQTSQQMIQEMMDTYLQLLNTPSSYLSGQAEQQQTLQQTAQQWMEQAQQQRQTFQQQAQQQQHAFQEMAQEVLSTYTQLLSIPISYAQEGVRGARFPIEGYDELTVEEVSGRLGGLSVEDLRVVRDHEERNKNRETVLEQLDRKIRGGS